MGKRLASYAPVHRLIRRQAAEGAPRIGLALGGGFARGIAHAGVLKVFEQHGIPLHCITGVSAGAIVAAAYASGTPAEDIARAGCSMRFGDVARWSLCRMGFMGSERMKRFLEGVLKSYRFEEMRIAARRPRHRSVHRRAGIVPRHAETCFCPSGRAAPYPGLFQPVRVGRPAARGRRDEHRNAGAPGAQLGATHVISVSVPPPATARPPSDIFQVVRRCFQIMQRHSEASWREASDLVMMPDLKSVDWNGFDSGPELVKAGETAALGGAAEIRSWLAGADLAGAGDDRLAVPPIGVKVQTVG